MPPIAQAALTVLSCYGCWRIASKLVRTNGRPLGLLIGVGFLARSVTGQILFWISYLRLPVGRSLQLGDGLWFFALDGKTYLFLARRLADMGPDGILSADRTLSSSVFVQGLASFVWLFGPPASVALLLNLYCYLLMCLAIIWLSDLLADGSRKAAAFAIAGVSLCPSWVLWSLQPLKDSLFVFLAVLLVAALAAWRHAWQGKAVWRTAVPAGLALWLTVYGLAGVRAYFAAVVCGACGLALAWIALQTERRRRLRAISAGLGLFLALSLAVYLAGGPYLAQPLRDVLAFRASAPRHAAKLVGTVERSRRGFQSVPGNTQVISGTRQHREGGSQHQRTTSERRSQHPEGDSPLERLGVGLAALLLPRALGEALGIFRIGGGRGFWAFAELDTLVFGLAVCGALVWIARMRDRRTVRNPIFLQVALPTFAMALGLAYVVTNYGTLFRLREMVFVGLCLIPLATISRETGRRAVGPAEIGFAPKPGAMSVSATE